MNPKTEFKNWSCGQFQNLLAVQAGVLLLCLAAASSPAQTYMLLHSFGTNVMGLYPHAPLVKGPDGMLYGTTEQGGSANQGQVFKVNHDGTGYTVLKDFTGNDGANPEAGLELSGTTLYGTTANGGTNYNGTVFKVNTDGSGFVVLKEFTGDDGAGPYAGLVLSGTTLYGTTANGGSFWNGLVFKLNTDGTGYTVLKEFTGDDGAYPQADLVLSDTTLYGTTPNGGSFGNGTVFKVNIDGSGFVVLKEFTGDNGAGPYAGLVLSGTTLYGTTANGGSFWNGLVFKLNTDGTGYTVLKEFAGDDGAYPHADLVLSDTTLYGTTPNGGSFGNGTLFKVNADGSDYTVLKNFTNSTDGADSFAGLMLSGTMLYGTTYYGGNNGFGTVFKVETDGSDYAVVTHFAGGDGAYPNGSLVLSGTSFYGTTGGGGASGKGIIFKVNTDGSDYTLLKDFTNSLNGANPNKGLALSGTTLYGTTGDGGGSQNGVVFMINIDGTGYTVLKDFTNSVDGANPNGSMVLSGTTLYGTTANGGSYGYGAVFKINTDGTGFDLLYSFSIAVWSGSNQTNADGAWPQAGLILSGSTLFGTTAGGGTGGVGAVFKVNTDGSDFNVLKDFVGADGAYPQGILVLSDTTLYGVTSWGGSNGNGTIFKVNTDSSEFTVLKSFIGSDGYFPQTDLLLSGTRLYGTTSYGSIPGYGTVFQVNTDGSDFAVLKYFIGSDGAYPQAGLVLSGSTLYGSTANGGGLDSGVLFSLSPGPPTIATSPEDQTTQAGSTVDLQVAVSGTPPLVYQWFFNETNAIGGATNSILELTNVLFSQSGIYSVIVTNSYGTVTGLVANLIVQDPFINNQPYDESVNAGDNVLFSVDAGGTSQLSYQWFKDGLSLNDGDNISGAQTPTLMLTNAYGGNAGAYCVVVSNGCNSIRSDVATLTVQDPFINSDPVGQVIAPGQTAQFSVLAGGTEPLSHEWRKNGNVLSWATASSLTLSNVQQADEGNYDVVVSNQYGRMTSAVAVLTVSLAIADSFNPGASGAMDEVNTLIVQPDGKILVGGSFSTLGGQPRNCIGRLNADGTLDASFNPGADAPVFSLALQPDDKILAGGAFSTLGGQTRNYIGRLNADGTLDTDFSPGTYWNVFSLAVQVDGKILAGGYFGIGRLNADGTSDTRFNPGADPSVYCIVVQADGRILVGGSFTTLGGQPCSYLGRLNVDGTLDTSFNPRAGAEVHALVVQPDGKIVVGGSFSELCGQPRNYIGRLNADGTLDTSFNPGAGAGVFSLALQPDGKILAGGWFTTLGGQARNYIGRLNANGTLDTDFNPGADAGVVSLTLQSDGEIVVGGDFTMLGGQPRQHIGRLAVHDPPGIPNFLRSQTAELGTTVCFGSCAASPQLLYYQWFFNGTNLTSCSTNSDLELTDVQFCQSGEYTVVITNLFGAVTSAPVMLNVIPVVERRLVIGVKVMGETGSSLNVEYTESLGPPPNWLSLDIVNLTNPPQYCVDTSPTLLSQRFYRAWQMGTPSIVPSLSLTFVPAITLTGNIGDQLRLDCINQIGPTDAWVTLDTVTLTNSSQLYFDVSSIGQPLRLYRIMPVP